MDEVRALASTLPRSSETFVAGASSSASATSSGSPSRATARRWVRVPEGVAERALDSDPEKFSLPGQSDLGTTGCTSASRDWTPRKYASSSRTPGRSAREGVVAEYAARAAR